MSLNKTLPLTLSALPLLMYLLHYALQPFSSKTAQLRSTGTVGTGSGRCTRTTQQHSNFWKNRTDKL